MFGVRRIFEEKVELDVNESKRVELLVGWTMKFVDNNAEFGESGSNEVHETVDGSVAGFRLSDSSVKHGHCRM